MSRVAGLTTKAAILNAMADALEATCCGPRTTAKFIKDAWADGQSFDLREGYAHPDNGDRKFLCNGSAIREVVERLYPGLGGRSIREWRGFPLRRTRRAKA